MNENAQAFLAEEDFLSSHPVSRSLNTICSHPGVNRANSETVCPSYLLRHQVAVLLLTTWGEPAYVLPLQLTYQHLQWLVTVAQLSRHYKEP